MSTSAVKIEPFDTSLESWTIFEMRLKAQFKAQNTKDENKGYNLLSNLGREAFATLVSLIAPDDPIEKSYSDLAKAMKAHYNPAPNQHAERYRFAQRTMKPGETISDFLTDLRKIAINCKYTNLDEQLKDKLIASIKDKATLDRLLATKEDELTYQKAVEIALSMETAAKDIKVMISDQPPMQADIHKMNSRPASQPNFHPRNNSYNSNAANSHSRPNTSSTPRQPHSAKPNYSTGPTCHYCGYPGHAERNKCPARYAVCHNCNIRGHYEVVCKRRIQNAAPSSSRNSHHLEPSSLPILPFFPIMSKLRPTPPPILLDILMDNKPVSTELDTGSAVSTISEELYRKQFSNQTLLDNDLLLRTYDGSVITPIGKIELNVKYNSQEHLHPFYIIKNGSLPLIGRDWMEKFKVNWKSCHSVSQLSLQSILNKNKELFGNDLGQLKNFTASLILKDGATPKYKNPRPVPFALLPKVEVELDRLVNEGRAVQVDTSPWGTPIVVVLKPNGDIRICGDYSDTLNPQLEPQKYPLPRTEEIFAKLAGGEKYTTIDLKWAFHQIILDEQSQELTTLSTHKGLYKMLRLPFGISPAAEIFQRAIDRVIRNLPGVSAFQDDVIVTGSNLTEHLRNLDSTLQRLREAGLRVCKEKCVFMADSVNYLGFRISKNGIEPTSDKLQAIVEAPEPKDIKQLRAFLGLANFYGKFIPNMATTLSPLHELLRDGTPWKWTPNCKQAFQKIKDLLSATSPLAHFDEKLPVVLDTDASAYGVGAALSHQMPDGTIKPIMFASRTLNSAQRNYAQIDKEALAIVFAVQKFHQYLFGRKFILRTDHRPLVSLFGPKKGIPSTVSPRMQRWALILSGYTYDIQYINTKDNVMADTLSRLPSPKELKHSFEEAEAALLHAEAISVLPVSAGELITQTRRDPVIAKVLQYTKSSWPEEVSEENLKPYFRKRTELTLDQGILFWGCRAVIPATLQARILTQLHEGHPGIVRTKSLAREHVWWPNIDSDIERMTKSCTSCVQASPSPPKAPLHPWQHPQRPYQRVHIDFAGPFLGHNFLLMVDAFSKWPEVIPMPSTTASATIDVLLSIFTRFGLPERLVTDNGPQFTSLEFAEFTKSYGIIHTFSPPYHPATNGAAENFVGTFKTAMRSAKQSNTPLNRAIFTFLLAYRSTPHCTTNQTPAFLMLKRELRTKMSLLRPSLSDTVEKHQQRQIDNHKGKPRIYHIGQKVWARNYSPGNPWIPAEITGIHGD